MGAGGSSTSGCDDAGQAKKKARKTRLGVGGTRIEVRGNAHHIALLPPASHPVPRTHHLALLAVKKNSSRCLISLHESELGVRTSARQRKRERAPATRRA